jgi:two-component system, OmpR family, sensor histidine kinase MprB
VSFRARLALVATAAVALAVIAASFVVWFVVRGQLYGQLDKALRSDAAEMARGPHGFAIETGPDGKPYLDIGRPFGSQSYVQLVLKNGKTARTFGELVPIPVSSHDLEIARGGGSGFSDKSVGDTKARVFTFGPGNGFALQVARSLGDVDRALSRIKLFLLLIAGGGIAVAGALGLLVARSALAPVRRLTETAEDVSRTRDLSQRIDVTGSDELSRLASTFNSMLAALEESARAQRQLVSDASHELRTPLTSLRTNIEVLTRDDALPPADRELLLRDVGEQLVEMSALVAELVELARGDRVPAEPEDVRLDLVAADAIARTERNRPGVTIRPELEETLVRGVPASIERAVSNLLDNAAKWSPPDGEIDVVVKDGELVVRDRGPGIDESDVPFVFDRFYRAPSARSLPGSGLGLAIVRQVAEAHGGTITVEAAEGGGTRMRLALPRNGTPTS